LNLFPAIDNIPLLSVFLSEAGACLLKTGSELIFFLLQLLAVFKPFQYVLIFGNRMYFLEKFPANRMHFLYSGGFKPAGVLKRLMHSHGPWEHENVKHW